jgi:hypothetical protein
MSDSQTIEIQLPDDRPPDWANSLMKWALTTPGLQSTLGQQLAILSFEGRRSAKIYTIPVSYHRQDDVVTIVTKRVRKWWHNFESPIEVGLRLAGRDYTGEAQIESDPDEALAFMTEYLKERPIDAKAYGLAKDDVSLESITQILPGIVVIRIEVTPTRLSRR